MQYLHSKFKKFVLLAVFALSATQSFACSETEIDSKLSENAREMRLVMSTIELRKDSTWGKFDEFCAKDIAKKNPQLWNMSLNELKGVRNALFEEGVRCAAGSDASELAIRTLRDIATEKYKGWFCSENLLRLLHELTPIIESRIGHRKEVLEKVIGCFSMTATIQLSPDDLFGDPLQDGDSVKGWLCGVFYNKLKQEPFANFANRGTQQRITVWETNVSSVSQGRQRAEQLNSAHCLIKSRDPDFFEKHAINPTNEQTLLPEYAFGSGFSTVHQLFGTPSSTDLEGGLMQN